MGKISVSMKFSPPTSTTIAAVGGDENFSWSDAMNKPIDPFFLSFTKAPAEPLATPTVGCRITSDAPASSSSGGSVGPSASRA